jgi:cytochrome b6-f complex iron-sulfur subunit
MEIQRRAFLKKTGATLACVCLACGEALEAAEKNIAQYDAVEDSKLIIDLSKHPKLKEAGGSETFQADKKKIIVLHPDERSYKAFENKCTHMGGQVFYRPKDGFMQCALHGSRFDTEGNVVKGPAEKPLAELETSLDKDQLTVYLS